MIKKSGCEGAPEFPVAFFPCSNGEAPPLPRLPCDGRAEQRYLRIVDEQSRRQGISRRDFMRSASGTAAGLFVMNEVYGCSRAGSASKPTLFDGSGRDARYDIDRDALDDQAVAGDALSGDEFIFDVQVHTVVAKPPWTADICKDATNANNCPSAFIKELFVSSDTDVACLSGFPAPRAADRPSIETRNKIKDIVDELSGSPRLVIHANVRPIEGKPELDAMEHDAGTFPVVAWKIYPEDKGLDTDEVGRPFIERARQLGVKIIAAHRGLTSAEGLWTESDCPRDVAIAARANPDFKFLAYHAGWHARVKEDRDFDPASANPKGVDRLIKAVLDNGLGKTGNLYAELGSTWYGVMRETNQAAHVLGKLLKYLGPDRILWGTDAMLNGGPQEQIAAFRRFSIPEAMQEAFGYPALTAEVKRKILGLNAAAVYGVDPAAVRKQITADAISKIKLAYSEDPESLPPQEGPNTRGPRTWREYAAFRAASGEAV